VEDAALFRTVDGGQTWQELSGLRQHTSGPGWMPGAGGMGLHTILLDPSHPQRIFIAISAAGVFRSDDAGETWRPINRGLRSEFLPVPDVEVGHCVHRIAMHPYGLGDELRAALMVDGSCWGLLCLHRAQAQAGFDPADVRALAGIGPVVAGALRRALVSEQAPTTDAWDGPGVVVLNADRTLQSSTAAAARWLDELADLDHPHLGRLPTVLLGVIEQLKASGDGEPGSARARVRAPSGHWLTVHASALDDASGSFAVVIEPTSPPALAPLIIAAYGLTNRESDVTQRLLVGLPRKAIASELRISLHTVNDHVKAVFDKTGVSSSGQLRAQVSGHLGRAR